MFNHISKLLAITIACSTLLACSAKKIENDYHGKTAEEIYAMSKQNLEEKRYFLAIKDLEALEARFPYGKYSDKAQLGLAYAHFKKGEFETALVEADRFLRLHPKHQQADYVYYLKGLINYEQNFSTAYKYLPLDRSKREPTMARQSFDEFKTLLKKYPNSQYAADAQKRMIKLKDQLADHELHIAKFYLAKGAYLAAANRANYIVHKFDKSKAMPEALVTMIKAYRNLGMHELANDALSTLKTNFPESKNLDKLS